MAKLIALVVENQALDSAQLLDLAGLIQYGTGLQLGPALEIEQREQTRDVFRDKALFRGTVEQLISDPSVQAVAFVFPPALVDDPEISPFSMPQWAFDEKQLCYYYHI